MDVEITFFFNSFFFFLDYIVILRAFEQAKEPDEIWPVRYDLRGWNEIHLKQ